ncbi:glycosyltransferase family 4 protein [Hylemonella sp. W303a]|uniref:glycosyltransferase family 4 protein n=1 Tax=Hylemonella sp. W303a TaxID=3389873 RepID=UPI00396B069F
MKPPFDDSDMADAAYQELCIENLPATQTQLRLAVVTETYPPEVNGVAMTLQRVVQGLRERGHQVQLVRPRQTHEKNSAVAVDKGRPAQTETELGTLNAQAQDVLMRGMAIPHYPHLQIGFPARRQLRALWSVQRPDLVHIATEGPLGWSALRVARKLRIPVTSDFRTNFHAYSGHYRLGWLAKPIMAYLKRFHNQAQATMVPTRELADQLDARGFERLHVVARGVDTQLLHPARRDPKLRAQWCEQAGVRPDAPVLLCVGRIAHEKNLGLLIAAWKQARLQQPELLLVLTGNGPAREELQAELAPYGPAVIFTGVLQGEALARCYASADIFAFPSRTETFGNVVLEAMASGLAVLAFDYAAAAQHITHGHNGLLAPLDDEALFSRQLLNLARDADLRARLRVRAHETARRCGWSGIVAQVETVMKQAIENPRGAAEPASRGSDVEVELA